ncbi:Protein TolB [termite gut metagenome]|uniref:Protein TolB n=1 Tax=termite gut metagenome TaxID=433724 RepID=A0A5J4RP49_9ZZZZ
MKQRSKLVNYATVTILLVLGLLTACSEKIINPVTVDTVPAIFPDYTDVTIPATIAPLNFTMNEAFAKINVVIEDSKGNKIEVQGKKNIQIPIKKWQSILKENVDGEITVTVAVKQENQWKQYRSFPIYISKYPIDESLAYRLIAPGYEIYSKMGIYQRSLSDFKQTTLLENTLVFPSCVNCHSFKQTSVDDMSLHVRGEYGGTILQTNRKTDVLNLKRDSLIGPGVYPYWHPQGKYIAYSVNTTQQMFHSAADERIEVVDLESDIIVYDIESNKVLTTPLLKTENFETFPSFSPDGKTLYFSCSSKQRLPGDYKEIRYNLCKIDFNPENGSFGTKIDTLVWADKDQKSISFARPSYDGKYIMYVLSDYGNFSIWHKEADLWLLDLQTGENRLLTEVNSPDTESYHSWSSNSHWFVFSSRRIDGLYTRPYIASIDETGKISKPFLLSQKHPDYYLESLFSFNIPEFVNGQVKLDISTLRKQLVSKQRK